MLDANPGNDLPELIVRVDGISSTTNWVIAVAVAPACGLVGYFACRALLSFFDAKHLTSQPEK
ncbi:MAG: hypothetical protein KDB27_23000 [Planctomycetales bacterium]|nr:hypothetical protein [Planctomycetales bacterium]